MIDDDDFIAEISHCIAEKDEIKIKVLLKEMGNVSPQVAQRLLFEISKSDDDLAIPLLLDIQVHLPNVAHSIPTLMDVLYGKIHTLNDCRSIYENLMSVEERCCFIEALCEYTGKDVSYFLIDVLTRETDVEILRSVLRTMEELKGPEFASVVADFLYSEDYKLVLQAIETLGRCVSENGIKALEGRAGSDMVLDRKIVGALAEAATPNAIQALVNMLGSTAAHLRNYSRVALVHLKERAVEPLAKALNSDNKDIVIIALNTLGETGVPEAVKPIRRFLQAYPEDANVRFSAYESLGMLPVKVGAYTLTDGLSDEVETVRMAAAKAVDHLYDRMFEMGLKNILEQNEHPQQIVEAFLVSECQKVFKALIGYEPFSKWVFSYFNEGHSINLLKLYAPLEPSGKLSKILSSSVEETVESEFQVCVVDDSRLLLRIYRKMLDEMGIS